MAKEERPDEIDDLMRKLGIDPQKLPPPEKDASPPGDTPRTGKEPEPPAEAVLEDLEPPAPAPAEARAVAPPAEAPPGLDLLGDVNVQMRIELGRTRLCVEDVLRLVPGSVVPLDALTSDPLDVYVNDRLVARGEVLVVDDNFAIRITEVAPPFAPSGE